MCCNGNALLVIYAVQLGLTCSSNITVPPVGAFEVDKAKRGCSQFDEAQVHEQGWGGDGKCFPLGKRSAYKICQDGAEEEHLQAAHTVQKRCSW